MIFIKINGLVLAKEKTKESDGIIYILTKNYGLIKGLARGIFKNESKNLSLLEPGNFNRFFILTNLQIFKIISVLPFKIPGRFFKNKPYIFLWTLKLIKKLKLPETPNFIWFILNNLESYLQQNVKNFPYWFLYHLLKELGYEIDLETCLNCGRKLKNFAYFNNKKNLCCFYCKKESYQEIEKKDLQKARGIKNIIKIPKGLPPFLKIMIKNSFLHSLK